MIKEKNMIPEKRKMEKIDIKEITGKKNEDY